MGKKSIDMCFRYVCLVRSAAVRNTRRAKFSDVLVCADLPTEILVIDGVSHAGVARVRSISTNSGESATGKRQCELSDITGIPRTFVKANERFPRVKR